MSARARLLDWAFWAWALVGVGLGFVISTIGIFTVPAAVLVALFLLRQPGGRAAAWGAVVGVGAVLLFVAFVNREGPGTVCHVSARSVECAYDLPDPKKWAAAGLVLVAVGLLGYLRPASARASRA